MKLRARASDASAPGEPARGCAGRAGGGEAGELRPPPGRRPFALAPRPAVEPAGGRGRGGRGPLGGGGYLKNRVRYIWCAS